MGGKVKIEVLASLAESLGMERTSEEVLPDQGSGCDTSVRFFLNQLGKQYLRFGRVVFDINAQKLTGTVIIFLNGRALELINGLETQLSDGDTLTFVPIIEGG